MRIRIKILFWITIPKLQFIYWRHPPNFVSIRKLLPKLLCLRTDGQTNENWKKMRVPVLGHTKHVFPWKVKTFFIYTNNTLSFLHTPYMMRNLKNFWHPIVSFWPWINVIVCAGKCGYGYRRSKYTQQAQR